VSKYAKLFQNGQSQAVRLPKEFRFEGDKVRIRRVGAGVMLEPVELDVKAYFAAIDSHGQAAADFMKEGRDQPLTPESEVSFDW
jgi:antitoxin VapB